MSFPFKFPRFEKKPTENFELVRIGDEEIFIPGDLQGQHGQLLLKIKMGGRFDDTDQQLQTAFLDNVREIYEREGLEMPDNYWNMFYQYAYSLE